MEVARRLGRPPAWDRYTVLYPWEVRAGAGPAGGGLRGHADGSKILVISEMRDEQMTRAQVN